MLQLPKILHKIAAMEFADRKKAGDEDKYHPRPSLAGPERCIRQMVYWGRGEERKPLGGRAVLVFDDSSWHEELTRDWINKSAYRVHSDQMEIDCGDGLVGHIDGIITDMIEVDTLLEHKALSHFGFQAIAKGRLPLDYITQICLYLRGLLKIQPDVAGAVLLIKNKNQAAYLEISIVYEPATDTAHILDMVDHLGEEYRIEETFPGICASAVQKFREVDAHIAAGTLPARQYDQSHWRCQYCGFAELCWTGWKAEMGERMADDECKMTVTIEQEAATIAKAQREFKVLDFFIKDRKQSLLDWMKDQGARKAVGPHFTATYTAQERKTIDKDKIPPDIRKAAEKISCAEILRIRQHTYDREESSDADIHHD